MPAETIVIGAGPYGLSTAAHLKAAGVPTRVFGKPMEFWRGMPAGMYLKSPWSASSLSDPARAFSLDRYVRQLSTAPVEPLPLPFFVDYGRWFQRHLVPDLDETYVRCVNQDGDAFSIELADGRRVAAGRVVVAAGIQRFAHLPAFAAGIPNATVSHTIEHSDFSSFAGKRVLVVGTGQSALESAALLHEAAAHVELVCRGPVSWVTRRFYDTPKPIRRIFYPPTDVGPPGINWVVAFPLLVHRLPESVRCAMYRRATRPAGARWLRSRVDGQLTITANAGIRGATPSGTGVRVDLSDGTHREVDHLLLGTGFRPDIGKLPFLSGDMLARVRRHNGRPLLNEWFESSVPNLHFIGGVANYSFGPLCNFVTGAGAPARQIARRAARRG
jgi:cation diffusion facilitator CzcD-associated flavoprotein CzcO